ncbi:MAG: Gldg family protein [Deltaproteobacteria bacterium]|nr:Gldg family protein [Deltaproteobacteria bacterium]
MAVTEKSGRYIKFCIYMLIVVLINVAGITLFFRLDLTANRVYSISNASKEVVSTLSEPLTIDVFFTKNLPAPHNGTEQYLHDLLDEYAIYANENFNYRFYDVSAEEGDISAAARENQELARNYGINPVQIQVIEKDEVKFQKAYMGLVLIHGDLIERIPTITSTDGLEYQLTTAIQKLNNKISALLRLKDKIRVKLFLSSSLKAVAPFMRLKGLADVPDKVKRIVEKLNEKNYGKLAFQYIDPTKEKDIEDALAKYHLLSLKWPALSGGTIPAGQGVIGIVMEYGKRAVDIPVMHVLRIPLIGKHYELVKPEDLEQDIDEAVESLIDINEGLGYLAGHGVPKLSPSFVPESMQNQQETLSTFHDLASANYTIKEVDLEKDGIPRDIKCMLVVGPTEPFTDYELFELDQFLMRGGNLALFVDAFKEVAPPNQQPFAMSRTPSFIPLSTGLEKLLKHWGLTIKKSFVMDENCYKQEVPARFGGGERPIYFAPIIKNKFINKDLDFMHNIKGLVAIKASPLEVDSEILKKNGLTARSVFSSSEKSWEMKGRINLNPMFIRPPASNDEKGSLALAYVLEGTFPSAFAGKPIPEKKAKKDDKNDKAASTAKTGENAEKDLSKIKGEGEVLSKGQSAKIFVMASSEMLKDNMLDEQGRTPNAMFIMNVLDFLNGREDIAVMRSKQHRFNPLDETSAAVKTLVKTFNIVGLPVLVVLFGLLVWFRRHQRKRQIQLMFQQ